MPEQQPPDRQQPSDRPSFLGVPFAASSSQTRLWVSPGVSSVGAASLFSDSGHEIATAVFPSFVTGLLRGSAGTQGVIGGLLDALLGVAKLVGAAGGRPVRRVRLARGGYTLTAMFTAAIGVFAAGWQAGVLRAAGCMARGPARDTMLASLGPSEAYGRSFGVERAGDNSGAVIGPPLAAGLVATVGTWLLFAFCLVPGLLAAVAISVAARRRASTLPPPAAAAARVRFRLAELRQAGLVRPLVPVALFELANIATTLLILRATALLHHRGRGLSAATRAAIVVYAAHNAVVTAAAPLGGAWIDKASPKLVLAAGTAVYVLGHAGSALPLHAWPLLLCAFCLAGRRDRAGRDRRVDAGRASPARPAPPERLRAARRPAVAGYFVSSASVGVLDAAASAASAASAAIGFGLAAGWMVLSLGASFLLLTRPGGRRAT